MNLGDLVVKYSHDYDDNDRSITIEDVGIILEGSWKSGFYRVLFSHLGVRHVSTGTIRRIGLRPPTSCGGRSSLPTAR